MDLCTSEENGYGRTQRSATRPLDRLDRMDEGKCKKAGLKLRCEQRYTLIVEYDPPEVGLPAAAARYNLHGSLILVQGSNSLRALQ
ncbi:hypothetical protein R1flu_008307 [Riccia fluitans]|uniref:Uncharacterized protein n=1 Tax=Riccia fluitans TaxID=41844 RepID=A0ABD1YEV9_9MARC